MALVYSQNWSVGAGGIAMVSGFYRQSPYGAPNLGPDAVYPEIVMSENIKVDAGKLVFNTGSWLNTEIGRAHV